MMAEYVVHVLTVAFAAGGAFAGVRFKMNGLSNDVKELKADVQYIRRESVKMRERMTRVETKLDL